MVCTVKNAPFGDFFDALYSYSLYFVGLNPLSLVEFFQLGS
jgi:hypothetical protein